MSHRFDDPIEFDPSDEIAVRCTYQSINRQQTTYFGNGPTDETCYGFITYYPIVDSFTYCGEHRTMAQCSNAGIPCNFESFNLLATFLNSSLCDFNKCSYTCRAMMYDFIQHECMQGDVGQFVMSLFPDVHDLYSKRGKCPLVNYFPCPSASAEKAKQTGNGKKNGNTGNGKKAGANKKKSAKSAARRAG